MSSDREVATVAHCLVCGTLCTVVIDTVPPASAFPGRKGTESFHNLLESLQVEHFATPTDGQAVKPASLVCDPNTDPISQNIPGIQWEYSAFHLSDRNEGSKGAYSQPNKARKSHMKTKSRSAARAAVSAIAIAAPPPFMNRVRLLPCPSCAETLSGLCWQDYLSSAEPVTLSPGVFYVWAPDELPALFLDQQTQTQGRGKRKWALAGGVAPPALELVTCRSGRLYAGCCCSVE